MAASFSIYLTRQLVGTTNLFSILGDGDKQDNSLDFSNFNPLSYKTSEKRNPVDNYVGTQISLRKTRMQELTNELLNAVGDESETQKILEDYREFLIEPLEEMEAVLDPDSVYSPEMSRSERYQAYRVSMDERLGRCKNGQVRSVLQSMRDFLMSFEVP